MSRVRSTLIASLVFAGASLGLGTGIAAAQTPTSDYTGTTVVAPPTTAGGQAACTSSVTALTQLAPGATVSLRLDCTRFVAGRTYVGTHRSTPVAIAPTKATANNTLTVSVKLPADYELKANHTITMSDQASGEVVYDTKYYVNADGIISAAPTGALPKTGSDYVDPALKAGGALLAAGALVLLVARRRRADATTPTA